MLIAGKPNDQRAGFLAFSSHASAVVAPAGGDRDQVEVAGNPRCSLRVAPDEQAGRGLRLELEKLLDHAADERVLESGS